MTQSSHPTNTHERVAIRRRSAAAPAYYLGRSAEVWMNADARRRRSKAD